ncbi:MAG: ABC transporter permease [Caulobacteraceae bacterium]
MSLDIPIAAEIRAEGVAKGAVACAPPLEGVSDGAPKLGAARQLVLEPGRAERNYWRDIWAYRELFVILAWRDVAVRYKQTVIGALWAVVRPFLTMVVFTVIFGRIAKLPSEGAAPYPIMVFAGMLPWFLFSTILGEASASLVGNANLIGKVYFPRIIIPTSSAVVALVDFAINLAMLAALMVWFGFMPTWRILLLPAFVVLAMLASLGAGAVDHGPQREVSRLPLHHPVHRAVRPLRLAGRLLQRRGAGALAILVQPQSGGGRDRRLPLVHPGRAQRALPAGLRGQPGRGRPAALARRRLFPPHRAHLRGLDLR